MDKEKVLKLAQLARVGISDYEAETLSNEFGAILDYVGQVKEVSGDVVLGEAGQTKEMFPHRNMLRDDVDAHESGIYTKEILNNAPQKNEKFIKVKKILT
ncbi:MAG: Asp-tRNA(Asn)/Glu-tRNA(Gln) amidotransferase subunit GatC [Minisyncoccia bacterium]